MKDNKIVREIPPSKWISGNQLKSMNNKEIKVGEVLKWLEKLETLTSRGTKVAHTKNLLLKALTQQKEEIKKRVMKEEENITRGLIGLAEMDIGQKIRRKLVAEDFTKIVLELLIKEIDKI
jgi:hypothetical protein